MLPDIKKFCHRTGFKTQCRKLVISEKCWLWVGVIGENPQTGETINEYGCADAWQHMLNVQVVRTQNGVAASSDKATNELRAFRNDMRALNGIPALQTQELPALPNK